VPGKNNAGKISKKLKRTFFLRYFKSVAGASELGILPKFNKTSTPIIGKKETI
jgi:hypothetical protein